MQLTPLFQPTPLTSLPPLSLYIHIPWCIQKCPYCDFNSHKIKTTLDEQSYIQALITDLETELPHIWGRPIETIFIGGGTPSLLRGAEITLEANPSTFEREKFHGFKEAGINRLSIGVQSFNDAHLAAIGRIHNAAEAHAAIAAAVQIFERVNIDIMYALPHQTADEAQADAQAAIAHGTSHISAYHLTLEPNTPFGHTPPQGIPDSETAQDIEDTVNAALATAGYAQYETSAFATAPSQRARHNLNYWQFGDYIGIGAGAHGKISYHSHIERTSRSRHPSEYLAAMQTQPENAIRRAPIAAQDLAGEFMMNALRLIDGVPSAFLPERTGINAAQISRAIQTAQQKGLLDGNPLYFRPTPLGQRFLNDLIELFL